MKIFSLITSIIISLSSYAQEKNLPVFPNGSRVCFVGNSITNNGEFHHNILLYHLTRFPDQQVTFFNCGISGDYAGGILLRMESDVLVNNPTHVVLMVGMNDVMRTLYGNKETTHSDTLRRRAEAITVYKRNLENIVELLLSKNIKIILQKPTIYDQTAILPTYNNFGVNDALKLCADFIHSLSLKYNLPVVDYWTIMTKLNETIQQKDPSATITSKDRVHPDATGHLVMAYQFLKTEEAPRYVSKIIVSAKSKKIGDVYNCEIKDYIRKKNAIGFTVRENSLPFPLVTNQMKALDLIPFTSDLNVELLQISGLKPGNYKLLIDDALIGTFNNDSLSRGVNLADYKETPQYQQALKVRSFLEQLWKLEANLRGLKFIEFNPHYKGCPDKTNIQAIGTYLDSVFTVKYTNPYYKDRLADYMKHKPLEREYQQKSDLLRKEAFEAAQPVFHRYEVRLTPQPPKGGVRETKSPA